jgi:dTMP kinase
MSGLLITFEGGEGSGKSTAIKSLGNFLLNKFGIVPVVIKEPGTTELGVELREILLHKNLKITSLAEAFIFQADRAEITQDVIDPQLLQNRIVIVDRFKDSSVAYQGSGRGIKVDMIRKFNEISTKGIIPDLTFLLDLDPRIGLQRKKDAGKLDKIDSEDIGFHERVRNGYLREAKQSNPERWVILNASLPKDELSKLIQEKVELKLMEIGYLEGQKRRKES